MGIRIISTKVHRFYNPNQKLLSSRETSDNMVVQDLAIPAAATIGKEKMTNELFFDTNGKPGEVQIAPDWVRADMPDKVNISTWKRAIKNHTITVLPDADIDTTMDDDEPAAVDPGNDLRGVAVAPAPGEDPLATMPIVDSSTPTRPLRPGRGRGRG